MSKAARIRELIASGYSYAEVAAKVGCRVEYVRATNSRANTGYAADVNYRRMTMAAARNVPGALEAARAASRHAYAAGKTPSSAYVRVMHHAAMTGKVPSF